VKIRFGMSTKYFWTIQFTSSPMPSNDLNESKCSEFEALNISTDRDGAFLSRLHMQSDTVIGPA
jgi:hypothetical protein